jgi:hypothetical protein
MEETIQLCKNMSIADAVHDNKIVENVQTLQNRSALLIEELQEKLSEGPATDVEACLLLCNELSGEIEKDILHVATETFSKGKGFPTKSTVFSLPNRTPRRVCVAGIHLDNESAC